MQPKVSVIVPVYNPPAQYLRECLDSICNQTLKDIEIILIDNAAIGDNPQILKEYAKKDKRIKLFRFEENQGYSGACNKGLEIATGEYIHFVDSDDYITPNAYELCCKRIEETQADFIFLAFQNYDMKQQKIINTYKYCFQSQTNKSIYTFNDIKQCIFFKETQAWNKFYRASFIKNNKNFFCPQLRRACQDALFSFTNYLNAHNMSQLDTPVYIYRSGVDDGIVGGLKKADCNYYNEIITFEEKAYKLMKSKMNKTDYRFMEDIILQSLKYFLDMLHSKNKKDFYKMSQNFIKKNKFFSMNDSLQSNAARKFYKDLKNLSFKEYSNSQPGQKIRRFFGLTIFKEKLKNGKKIKRWFWGLKKIKSAKYTKYKLWGIPIWYHKKHSKQNSYFIPHIPQQYNVWIFSINTTTRHKKFYWFRCKLLHLKQLDNLAEQLLIRFGYKDIYKQMLLVHNCPFWDETYYISTYNYDASKTHLSPLEHYLKIGWIEGKNPSELFDGNSYYRRYAHIADTPMLSFFKNVTNNPLVNFLEYGRYNYYYPYTYNKFPATQTDIDKYWIQRRKRNKSNKVVYSCITGSRDTPLKAFRYIAPDWDYVLFTDNQKLVDAKYYGMWEIRPLQIHLAEDRRTSRWHKIHPHILFPDYDISIWVDGNVNVISSYIFDKVKFYTKNLLVPNHCCRFCLYDEGKIAIRTKSDNPEVVKKQMEEIKATGFPSNYGLPETNLLYRKHNDPQIIKIMNDWWSFVGTKSIRDQCSFPFALYKSGYIPKDYIIPNTRMLLNDFCIPIHSRGKK